MASHHRLDITAASLKEFVSDRLVKITMDQEPMQIDQLMESEKFTHLRYLPSTLHRSAVNQFSLPTFLSVILSNLG